MDDEVATESRVTPKWPPSVHQMYLCRWFW